MRVILHMGPHKTGTTSIQAVLRRNADALAAHAHVVVPGDDSLIRPLAQCAWRYSLGKVDRATLIDTIQVTGRTLQQTGAKTLLISHENLCGAMLGSGKVTGFYPHLPELLDLYDAHLGADQLDYVFYTRAPESWVKSVYNQAVKSSGYAHSFDRFCTTLDPTPHWDQLSALGSDSRSVTTFALEAEAKDHPGAQLLAHLGLTQPQIAALAPLPESRNQSLTPGALEYMRLTNALNLTRPSRREITKTVMQNQGLFDTLTDVLVAHRKEH